MAANIDPASFLGPFPFLQLLAAVVVLGVCVFAWVRGSKKDQPVEEPLQTILRMDGPIAITIGLLKQIAESMERTERHSQRIAEEASNQRRLLEELNRQRREHGG
jgi:hypothetical protein